MNEALKNGGALNQPLVLLLKHGADISETPQLNPDNVTLRDYCATAAHYAFLGDPMNFEELFTDNALLISIFTDGVYLLDPDSVQVGNMSGVTNESIGECDVNFKVGFKSGEREFTAIIGNENDT